jgi:hypothetical protein
MSNNQSIKRTLLHTRSVIYKGYLREDGLWDIEGVLRDDRAYESKSIDRPVIPVGEPLHDLWIRVTLDDDMKVVAIDSGMFKTPINECPAAQASMQSMVGVTMGRGWREAINSRMGDVRGCTHMRELLFNMATAAFQTIPFYRDRMVSNDKVTDAKKARRSLQMGQCMSWDPEGPFVQRLKLIEG